MATADSGSLLSPLRRLLIAEPDWLRWLELPWAPYPVAAVAVGLDQLSKWAIVQHFLDSPTPYLNLIGDFLRLTYATNTGMAFGLFPGGTLVLALIGLAVLPVLIWVLARAKTAPLVRLAVSLMLGGAIGNLIDRLRDGRVVDFIDVGVGQTRFWTFNVADSCFVVGTILVVAYMLVVDSEG